MDFAIAVECRQNKIKLCDLLNVDVHRRSYLVLPHPDATFTKFERTSSGAACLVCLLRPSVVGWLIAMQPTRTSHEIYLIFNPFVLFKEPRHAVGTPRTLASLDPNTGYTFKLVFSSRPICCFPPAYSSRFVFRTDACSV
jgi:hypothetical protein